MSDAQTGSRAPGGTLFEEPRGRRDRTLGVWTRLILRRWPVIVAFVLAGLALGAGYSLTQPTLFAARSTLVLSPQSGVLDPANSQDLPALAETIARLTVTDSVLLDARERFAQAAPDAGERDRRSARDLDWMKTHVSAAVLAGTSLVEISARDGDAVSASDLTAAAGETVTAKVAGLGTEQTTQAGLSLTSLGEPTGQGQVSPNLARNLILGGNLGLVLGIIAAAFMADRGLRIRGRSELAEALGVTRMVALPMPRRSRATGAEPGLGDLTVKPDDPLQEAYRLLRSRLVSAADRGASRIAVLGPVPPAVLRASATALGAHLCAAGASTVVVEADFHGTGWAVDGGGGLGDILAGTESADQVRILPVPIRRFDSDDVVLAPVGLGVLPAGTPPPDPAGALVSPQAADLLDRLAAEYRHVIVVGPSSEWQAESMTLSERTDATLLILRDELSVDQAREIRDSYEAEPGRLLAIAVLEVRRG